MAAGKGRNGVGGGGSSDDRRTKKKGGKRRRMRRRRGGLVGVGTLAATAASFAVPHLIDFLIEQVKVIQNTMAQNRQVLERKREQEKKKVWQPFKTEDFTRWRKEEQERTGELPISMVNTAIVRRREKMILEHHLENFKLANPNVATRDVATTLRENRKRAREKKRNERNKKKMAMQSNGNLKKSSSLVHFNWAHELW